MITNSTKAKILLSLIDINILNKDKNWLLYQNYELEDLLNNISCNIDSLRNNKVEMNKRLNVFHDFVEGDDALMTHHGYRN